MSCSSDTWAKDLSAKEYFQQGMQFFRSGQLEQASQAFQNAIDSGLNDSRAYFNLGISLYKQRLFTRAYQAFSKVGKNDKLAFLGQINSGLCAIKLEQKSLAISHFNKALALAKTRSQKQLAVAQLDNAGYTKHTSYDLDTKVFFGYSDNVSFSNETIVSKSDQEDRLFSINGNLSWRYRSYVGFGFSYSLLDYIELNQYDYQKYHPSVWLGSLTSRYSYKLDVGARREYLASSAILDAITADVIASYTVKKLKLQMNYEHTWFKPQKESYEHLRGTMLRPGLSIKHSIDSWIQQLAYVYESNNRQDSPINDASPDRSKWYYQLKSTVARHEFSTFYSSRKSIFKTQQRTDRQTLLSLDWNYSVSESYRLLLQYQQIRNRSNNPLFNYKTNVISLGLQF